MAPASHLLWLVTSGLGPALAVDEIPVVLLDESCSSPARNGCHGACFEANIDHAKSCLLKLSPTVSHLIHEPVAELRNDTFSCEQLGFRHQVKQGAFFPEVASMWTTNNDWLDGFLKGSSRHDAKLRKVLADGGSVWRYQHPECQVAFPDFDEDSDLEVDTVIKPAFVETASSGCEICWKQVCCGDDDDDNEDTTTTTTEAPVCDDFDVTEGKGLMGKMLKRADGKTTDDCCEGCDDLAECHGWELLFGRWCNYYPAGNMKEHKSLRSIIGIRKAAVDFDELV
jgi:hypothetical protein